ISPKTGRVIGWIDLTGLLTPREAQEADASGGVLNGIAYDAARDRLFVTGKLWPKLFEITIQCRCEFPAVSCKLVSSLTDSWKLGTGNWLRREHRFQCRPRPAQRIACAPLHNTRRHQT